MIKGKKIESIDIDYIMKMTNNGYDIFKYYLGNVGRIMNRPWGGKEKTLSWGIFYRGIWFYKDYGKNEETGNAIHFVQKYFSLTFKEAIDKINWDFGLGGKLINVSPVVINWEKPDIEKDYMEIDIIDMPFQKRHHDYWNSMSISEDHCRKYNTFAVKSLAIKKRRFNIRGTESVFAYWSPEEKGYKIYFPDRKKESRFRNNVSGHYLWNYENIKECDNLIIQKSMKDLLVTTMLTPCVISTQNESAGIFDSDMVKKINKISKTPWVWYGSDEDGVNKCKKITGMNKWNYINTPKNLLPDVNDAAEFVKMHNLIKPDSGLKELEKFMKEKKLL